jgi:hypothetical protein
MADLFPLSICLAETAFNRIFGFPATDAIRNRYLEMLSTFAAEELFRRVLDTYSEACSPPN